MDSTHLKTLDQRVSNLEKVITEKLDQIIQLLLSAQQQQQQYQPKKKKLNDPHEKVSSPRESEPLNDEQSSKFREAQMSKHKQILIEELRPFIDKPKKGDNDDSFWLNQSQYVYGKLNAIKQKKSSSSSSTNSNTIKHNQEEIDFRRLIAKWNLFWVNALIDYFNQETHYDELLSAFQKNQQGVIDFVSVKTSRYLYYLIQTNSPLIDDAIQYWQDML